MRKYNKIILILCYASFVLSQTIIGRPVNTNPIFRGLFWEIQNGMWRNIQLNIVLFIPLGLLIGGRRGLIVGFLLSCAIELVQYFGHLGFCEIDDVLNNTIGASIGVGINYVIRKNADYMGLRKWDDLPEFMKIPEVRPYWEILNKKKSQIIVKRIFDFIVAIVLLLILAIPMAIIAVLIKMDSEGPIFYRQERVTAYGKHFRIHKFRTMVSNADRIGTTVTVGNDNRITKIGAKIRSLRLDELPQVIDVIKGDMSFVGTRPEAVKYVERYKPEYYATLLLPAGITSEASIRYKDEDKLLNSASDVDDVYVNQVLPAKMVWNIESIIRFRFLREILTMFRTVFAVLGKDYN